MTREAYHAERDHLEAEAATLRGATDRAGLLTQAAALLRDLPAAWAAAAPEQRNALGRLVFHSVEITDDRVVAVVPQADFAPFFLAQAGADGVLGANGNGAGSPAPSTEVMTGRKRRESLSRLHPSARRNGVRRGPAPPRERAVAAGLLPHATAA